MDCNHRWYHYHIPLRILLLEFYKALADDNKARLDEVLSENADLRKEVTDLREQVSRLTSALAQYGLQKLIEEKGE